MKKTKPPMNANERQFLSGNAMGAICARLHAPTVDGLARTSA
jgi:hypothetical protein